MRTLREFADKVKEIGVKVQEVESMLADLEKMENKEQALPKCGRCGGEAEYISASYINGLGYHIQCQKCGMRTETHPTQEEALKSWFTDKPEKSDDIADALVMHGLGSMKNAIVEISRHHFTKPSCGIPKPQAEFALA